MPKVDSADSADGQPEPTTPQLRVLQALRPAPEDVDGDYPIMTRDVLTRACGFRPGSGTINRALNGAPDGSSTTRGMEVAGMLCQCKKGGIPMLGWVEIVEYDLDGIREINYRLTELGVAVLRRYDRTLAPVRDWRRYVNTSYTVGVSKERDEARAEAGGKEPDTRAKKFTRFTTEMESERQPLIWEDESDA